MADGGGTKGWDARFAKNRFLSQLVYNLEGHPHLINPMRQVNIMIIDNEVPSESSNPFPEDVLSEISEESKEESPQPSDHEETGESLPLSDDEGGERLPPSDNEGGATEGKKRGGTPQFTKFLEAFEGNSSPEEKIRLSMEFMRSALVHQGAPRFRDFWEGRKLCLPLFRENLSPKARSQLWGEYIELHLRPAV